ncbi:hypothetical protein [Thiorhodospira sibirica]|uniref:hypothetical protein n=1 Tax=Thiorhodospira sibirica TaxID=154347 RepID=UPI00022C4C5D|nr:hypothetical protein [Thiorhodospira sibirica]
MKSRIIFYTSIILVALSASAQAGGQYVVGDAALIDARSCEAEIWYTDVKEGGYGTFLAPTCRLDGNWQLTLGAGNIKVGGESEQVFGLEAKVLFMDMESHDFGLGLVAGAEYGTEDDRWEIMYAYVPASIELTALNTQLNANLGVERDRTLDKDKNTAIWGLGLESRLLANLSVIAEISGAERSGSDALAQIGPRVYLFDEMLALDLTYSRETGGDKIEAYSVAASFTVVNF